MTETIETSRRGFLRGLIAAAVATQLPDIPAARAEAVVAAVEAHHPILINGEPLRNLTITDVGDGWFRLVGECPDSVTGSGSIFDFRAMNNGNGLFASDEIGAEQYLAENPTHIATRGASFGAIFSCYFKPGPEFKGHAQVVLAPQINHPPVESQYILASQGRVTPVTRAVPSRHASRAAAYSHLPRWQRPGGR